MLKLEPLANLDVSSLLLLEEILLVTAFLTLPTRLSTIVTRQYPEAYSSAPANPTDAKLQEQGLLTPVFV